MSKRLCVILAVFLACVWSGLFGAAVLNIGNLVSKQMLQFRVNYYKEFLKENDYTAKVLSVEKNRTKCSAVLAGVHTRTREIAVDLPKPPVVGETYEVGVDGKGRLFLKEIPR